MTDRNWAMNGETRIFRHLEKGEFVVRDHVDNWRLFFGDEFTRMYISAAGLKPYDYRRLADYTGGTVDIATLCHKLGWVGPMGLVNYPWDTLQIVR